MAHRIISQVVFSGARVLGRAFAESYKQMSASQKYAQHMRDNPSAVASSKAGLTLDEACKILNVPPPKMGTNTLTETHERFKRLFDLNDPKKGGSFYLQSKVLRARERIEMEVRDVRYEREHAEEIKKGWKPKIWQDGWEPGGRHHRKLADGLHSPQAQKLAREAQSKEANPK